MAVLRLKMLRGALDAAGRASVEEFSETVLAERYSPLLASTLKVQARTLALDLSLLEAAPAADGPYVQNSTVFCEVFPTPYGVVALEVTEPDARYSRRGSGEPESALAPSTLTLFGIGSEQIAEPLQEIGGLLSDRFGIDLEDLRYTNPQFQSLRQEGRVPSQKPSAEEEASARLLTDDLLRQAAIGIAQSGGLLRQDLPKHLGDAVDRSAEIERRLRDSLLVDVEVVVTCKRRSTQVARAPSRDALQTLAENGVTCACGRAVLDERIDEALTLTPHGRKMLTGSYWMTILVIAELQELGVRLEDMLVEQVSGGDEMDFFADVSGELFLLELKDKEFNLGNAYSFGSKTGIFQPSYPVIVTSAYVGNDAKEHFKQAALARRAPGIFPPDRGANPAEPAYVEGIANLHDRMEELVGRVYASDAGDALSRLMPAAAASGRSVVRALAASVGRRPDGAPAESPPPDVSESAGAPTTTTN